MGRPKEIAREDALAAGKSTYFTGKPCKKGHIAPRFVRSYACTECNLEFRRAYRKQYPDRYKEYDRLKYHERGGRERMAAYKRARRAHFTAKEGERCSRRKEATPHWLTTTHEAQMQWLYSLRDKLSTSSGTLYHVDHIIPLIHENVCGLHVPWNLRLLPASVNIAKGNTYSEDGSTLLQMA